MAIVWQLHSQHGSDRVYGLFRSFFAKVTLHGSCETYTERQKKHHFFRAMLTKIHNIKIK